MCFELHQIVLVLELSVMIPNSTLLAELNVGVTQISSCMIFIGLGRPGDNAFICDS